MAVIRSTEARRTETPNAVMTTLASPTLGDAALSVWRVEMEAGQAGPPHAFDAEQVWTVIAGGAAVDVDGAASALAPGDTIVIPAGAARRVVADPTDGLTAIVTARPGARATMLDGTDRGVPDWIA